MRATIRLNNDETITVGHRAQVTQIAPTSLLPDAWDPNTSPGDTYAWPVIKAAMLTVMSRRGNAYVGVLILTVAVGFGLIIGFGLGDVVTPLTDLTSTLDVHTRGLW